MHSQCLIYNRNCWAFVGTCFTFLIIKLVYDNNSLSSIVVGFIPFLDIELIYKNNCWTFVSTLSHSSSSNLQNLVSSLMIDLCHGQMPPCSPFLNLSNSLHCLPINYPSQPLSLYSLNYVMTKLKSIWSFRAAILTSHTHCGTQPTVKYRISLKYLCISLKAVSTTCGMLFDRPRCVEEMILLDVAIGDSSVIL